MEETITHDGKIVAVIIKADESFSETRFFTPPEFSQQLGFIIHKSGHIIQPHTHNRIQRNVVTTLETLIIRKGKVKVLLYTEERKFLRSAILEQGDVILLASGGHGFEILEDAEMIEVKQGPYIDTMVDKSRFDFPPDKKTCA